MAGEGLGPSFAPPIQRTHPCPMLPGLQSCYHHDGYHCACKRTIFAITRTRDVHEWGSTGEGWEGGDGVVWINFCHVCHGCESGLESERTLLLKSLPEVWYKCVGIKMENLWTIASRMKLLDCYVKGLARMNSYLGRLCPRPPDPNTIGKLKISASFMCY
jgi:hypothetical protein